MLCGKRKSEHYACLLTPYVIFLSVGTIRVWQRQGFLSLLPPCAWNFMSDHAVPSIAINQEVAVLAISLCDLSNF